MSPKVAKVRFLLLVTFVASAFVSTVVAHEHNGVRAFAISSQLAQVGNDAVVVIGDSITEGAFLPAEICGKPVVNAGVGGASAGNYVEKVLTAMPRFKASVIVVALGTNDALAKNKNFRTDYENLLDVLTEYSPTIILAGIPTTSGEFESDVREIAARRKMSFVPLKIEGEDMTTDGIHLSPTGYEIWTPAVVRSARKVIRKRASLHISHWRCWLAPSL